MYPGWCTGWYRARVVHPVPSLGYTWCTTARSRAHWTDEVVGRYRRDTLGSDRPGSLGEVLLLVQASLSCPDSSKIPPGQHRAQKSGIG